MSRPVPKPWPWRRNCGVRGCHCARYPLFLPIKVTVVASATLGAGTLAESGSLAAVP
jgi:hypothetical protein